MNLQKVSLLGIALFLFLFAVNAFGWVAVSATGLGIVALVVAILVSI